MSLDVFKIDIKVVACSVEIINIFITFDWLDLSVSEEMVRYFFETVDGIDIDSRDVFEFVNIFLWDEKVLVAVLDG